jgi:hypothetical protein
VSATTLQKIADQEQAVAVQVEQVRTQIDELTAHLNELEARLNDFITARKVILDLPADEAAATENPLYPQILAILTDAQAPMRSRDLCRILDLGFEPKTIEGMRHKLKRLVGNGLATENEPGQFALLRS